MKYLFASFILLLTSLAYTAGLSAQTSIFGKNKVSYDEFDWMVMKSEHFDIYYYREEEYVARLALLASERSYEFLRERLNHEIVKRVPFIVYSSHEHFEQTNVISSQIPEGVLGFTEYMKGRVAIPFGGSISDFNRVIRHEMVHVFQNDIIARQHKLFRRISISRPPLWFTEGLAEFYSSVLTPRDEMFLRDMVGHGRIKGVGELWKFGGSFPVYKAGESFIRFIADEYGDGRLVELLKTLWMERTFREAVLGTFGRTLSELSDEWVERLEATYTESERETADERTVRISLVDEVATKPTAYRSSDGACKTLYFAARLSTVKIKEVDRADPDHRRIVLTGGKDAIFESLHPFGSRMDVGPGGILAFSSKHNDRDGIILWDLEEGKILGEYRFEELIEIQSPVFSPGGKRIAFTGLAPSGMQDIFIYEITTGKLRRITSDFYADRDPDWSPDGERIVFSSDRTVYGEQGYSNLFLADLNTGELRHLTYGKWNDTGPRWSPAGDEILFLSDRDGYWNVYVVDELGGGRQIVEMREGVFDADWGPEGDEILLSMLDDLSISIHRMDYDSTSGDTFDLEIPGNMSAWIPGPVSSEEPDVDIHDYEPHYSFDIATGGVGFSSAYGTSQGAQFLISDTLGDRLILLQVNNTATEFSDVLRSMNVTAAYLNRKHRIDIGLGAFHTGGLFVDYRKSDFPFREQQYGGFLLLSYPFSKFSRLETSLSLYRSKRSEVAETFDRDSFIAANTVSFTRDNTVWFPLGPIEGERYSIGVTLENDITRAEPENVLFDVDYRRYFRTGLASTYAVRLQARMSEGSLPDRSFIGGSWSMRGYPRYSIIGTHALLLNQEWRFLLLRNVLRGQKAGSIWLPPLEGALFFDVGDAWDPDGEGFSALGSFGFGLRVGIAGPFILRFDFSKRTDFDSVSGKLYTDFWIGYDY